MLPDTSRAIFILLLCAAIPLPGGAQQPYARVEGKFWIAGNGAMEIAVDQESGTVRKLLDKVSGEDYCNQTVKGEIPLREFEVGPRIAGLTLFDELREKEFSDLADKPAVTAVVAGQSGGASTLSFQKRFPGAEFVVTETFR